MLLLLIQIIIICTYHKISKKRPIQNRGRAGNTYKRFKNPLRKNRKWYGITVFTKKSHKMRNFFSFFFLFFFFFLSKKSCSSKSHRYEALTRLHLCEICKWAGYYKGTANWEKNWLLGVSFIRLNCQFEVWNKCTSCEIGYCVQEIVFFFFSFAYFRNMH